MKEIVSLPLGEVTAGMQVAEAVLDAGGHVLVPAAAEVSESMLHGLARREIAEIRVVREVVEDAAASEARRARLARQLDQLFRKAGDGAETRLLYQAILDYRMESGT